MMVRTTAVHLTRTCPRTVPEMKPVGMHRARRSPESGALPSGCGPRPEIVPAQMTCLTRTADEHADRRQMAVDAVAAAEAAAAR